MVATSLMYMAFCSIKGAITDAESRFVLPYFLMRRTSFTQTAFVRNQPRIDQGLLGVGDTFFGIRDTTPSYSQFSVGTESRVRHAFSRQLSGLVPVFQALHEIFLSLEAQLEPL